MGGEGKLLGWQIYDRFKLYLFDERRNNGFLFFFLFLECGNFAYNVSHQVDPRQEDDRKCQSVECVESSIEREREREGGGDREREREGE